MEPEAEPWCGADRAVVNLAWHDIQLVELVPAFCSSFGASHFPIVAFRVPNPTCDENCTERTASPGSQRGEILTFPDTPTTQGLSLHVWCFNTVGGEILTFPDTPTTQGLSLWCFNTVGGEILTFPDTPTTQGLSLWCFNTVLHVGRTICSTGVQL